jgi:hypothetical protein
VYVFILTATRRTRRSAAIAQDFLDYRLSSPELGELGCLVAEHGLASYLMVIHAPYTSSSAAPLSTTSGSVTAGDMRLDPSSEVGVKAGPEQTQTHGLYQAQYAVQARESEPTALLDAECSEVGDLSNNMLKEATTSAGDASSSRPRGCVSKDDKGSPLPKMIGATSRIHAGQSNSATSTDSLEKAQLSTFDGVQYDHGSGALGIRGGALPHIEGKWEVDDHSDSGLSRSSSSSSVRRNELSAFRCI